MGNVTYFIYQKIKRISSVAIGTAGINQWTNRGADISEKANAVWRFELHQSIHTRSVIVQSHEVQNIGDTGKVNGYFKMETDMFRLW
nr:hypothetical protein BgiMline_006920 [Biomphalaria glabrata]